MINKILILSLLLLPVLVFAQDPLRFEKEIKVFEKNDSINGPKKKVNLFIGSSTIRRWDNLANYFPGAMVLNRGFGGSHTSDAIHFAERIVGKHKPVQVLVYEGDNDIASGKPVEQVYNDLITFISALRTMHKKAVITYIAVKPSPARMKYLPQVKELNEKMKQYALANRKIQYADVFTPMLNELGRPIPSLYVSDSVHLTKQGYDVWAHALKGYIK
ncbi:GDSL-type esterase/lipase family protein [Aridibaculum aurantiacum]|uniref:GDSL-type esterase/lipase family protein n=1 Tax=Aridibaculum aurantiacum TaxID=2810307 RepID=UPI001A97A13C|nr:GDSL-type esterase/lipase family protein [Aridibaculum aurantiacum]